MIEGIADKLVVMVTVERRLEIDGVDSMEKILEQAIIPLSDDETVLDKVRELLKKAEQNTFTFL